MKYGKAILITMLYTFLVLTLLVAVFVGIMFFAFPKSLANFMYNVGFDRMASTLYYRVYEKTDDITYCYKALNIKITIEDHNRVVKYYESFIEHEDYEDFMLANKVRKEQLEVSVLEKSAIINDDNYLVNNYVEALLKIGQKDKAVDVAVGRFITSQSLMLDEQGVYALGAFVDDKDWEVFNIKYLDLDSVLYLEMQEYFEYLVEMFNGYKGRSGHLDRAYLLALGNRIINLGQDIHNVYKGLDLDDGEVRGNVQHMLEVNSVIKGLI